MGDKYQALRDAVKEAEMMERPEGQKLYGLNYMEMRGRIKTLEATLERMRALIAEAEVIAEYGRDDGLRDWVDVGAWLSPGDRIVVLPGQQ